MFGDDEQRHDQDAQRNAHRAVVGAAVQPGADQRREKPGQASDEQIVETRNGLMADAFQRDVRGDLGRIDGDQNAAGLTVDEPCLGERADIGCLTAQQPDGRAVGRIGGQVVDRGCRCGAA